MAEEVAFKNGRFFDFEGLVTLTLTLDRVTLHTFMHHLSTSTYTVNVSRKRCKTESCYYKIKWLLSAFQLGAFARHCDCWAIYSFMLIVLFVSNPGIFTTWGIKIIIMIIMVTYWPIVKQKVVPILLNARALGSEMPVADDYYAESALKITPSPFAGKPTSTTCWKHQTNLYRRRRKKQPVATVCQGVRYSGASF